MKHSHRVLVSRLARPVFWCSALTLAALLVQGSWMKWMDPQVDLGHELYSAWRIQQGEHLGREIVQAYGPLSDYVNAAILGLFGTSVLTLVLANLAIFAGIVVLLHRALRHAFGFFAASMATLMTIAVFGFGHYVANGNYTYAAPYAHEATHGMALLLGLINLLDRPPKNRAVAGGVVGLVVGLMALTKTEFVVAGAALLGATVARHWVCKEGLPYRWLAGCTVGAMTPLTLAFVLLWTAMDARAAAMGATSGILAPLYFSAYSTGKHVLAFLGADNPAENLWHITRAGVLVLLGGALLLGTGRVLDRLRARPWRLLLVGGVAVALVALALEIRWFLAGLAFPGLLLAGTVWLVRRVRQERREHGIVSSRLYAQGIFFVAGLAMLLRMALAPRLFHYGFFQAMLAAAWLCGFLLSDFPRMLAATKTARIAFGCVFVVFLGIGTLSLVQISQGVYALKTVPVGTGSDRIYGLQPAISQIPSLMEDARQVLLKEALPEEATLLVVPEGSFLNYLLRRKQPLRLTDLLPATLKLNGGDVLQELERRPPSYIVAISRDTREQGYAYFGSEAGSGQAIANWMEANYSVVAGKGPAPFESPGAGMRVLKLRSPSNAERQK